MKAILLAFLMQLEAIGAADPSLFTLDVLQRVHAPIEAALVEGRADVAVPATFGLASPEADRRVREAVTGFIRDARASGEFAGAPTEDARIDLLFADTVETPRGAVYDDYFAFAAAP